MWWPEATPLTDQTSDSVAEVFVSIWIALHCTHRVVTTDQGSQFALTKSIVLLRLLSCDWKTAKVGTSVKVNLNALSAEPLFGIPLRLPGEWFLDSEIESDSKPSTAKRVSIWEHAHIR